MNNSFSTRNFYTPADFYQNVQQKLKSASSNEYIVFSIDFDNFKYINELFGYDFGDQTLIAANEYFSTLLDEDECFAKIHADHFVFLLKNDGVDELINRLNRICDLDKCFVSFLPSHYKCIVSGGIYIIEFPFEKILTIIDKANFARKQVKGNHSTTFNFFTKEMSEELRWKKEITLFMEEALLKHEFEMYLQPKILIKTNEVTGAEALVRWNTKKNGLIYPDQFIPVFEQNGFIIPLDFYMLEQVCIFLKKCETDGLPVLPISVNFSKSHINTPNFVKKVQEIVANYDISPQLIEIELTENVFSCDYQKLIEIVRGFKSLNFKVSLDDFGSAYSSLSFLKDFPVDIIKIDKGFLDAWTNTDKGKLIIAKIVEMVKSLRLVTVMEGVEDQEHVDFLQKLNCDIGQGYFYARPMMANAYIDFILQNLKNVEKKSFKNILTPKDESLGNIPKEFLMDNWELFTLSRNIDMGLMKGLLDEDMTVDYINEKALSYLGYTAQEFHELLHNKFVNFLHPSDVPMMQKNIYNLLNNGQSFNFQVQALRKNGQLIHLSGKISCTMDNYGRPNVIYAFQDVSENIEKTKNLYDKMRKLETLYSNIPGGVIYCSTEPDFEIYYYNEGFLQLIGYSTEELEELFDNKLLNLVIPQDRNILIDSNDQLEDTIQLEYRIHNKYNKTLWVLDQGQITEDEYGVEQFCCVLIDISSEIESREALRISEERYKIIVEQSDDIMFEWNFIDDSIIFSDKYQEILGCDPIIDHVSQNKRIFENIHVDDHEIFEDWIRKTYQKNSNMSFEFRFKTEKNDYVWMKSRSTPIFDDLGNPVKTIGVFSNIDHQKTMVDHLKIKSQQDSLTKLFNKEESRKNIEKILEERKTTDQSAFLIIDIDNFKSINDHLGHQFGDAVLTETAQKVKSCFSDSDIVGRLGGDEFVVFMQDVSKDNLIEKVYQLSSSIRSIYFGENKQYKISGSIGISCSPQHGTSFEKLYNYADIALYESKNKGKV